MGEEGKNRAFGSKETETTAKQATKSRIVDTINSLLYAEKLQADMG